MPVKFIILSTDDLDGIVSKAKEAGFPLIRSCPEGLRCKSKGFSISWFGSALHEGKELNQIMVSYRGSEVELHKEEAFGRFRDSLGDIRKI
ncbi:MAG: hypothetical protein QG635_1718 [Bacteroidota bacterium]|nr:hypothetical protein [Bacteroidota bacterium]